MLNTIREKTTGWIATVVVGLLIIPFAFFGLGDYFSGPGELWVAKVGDQEISQQAYRQRFDEYRQQTRQAMGENFDARELDRPEVKRRLLDTMIDEELLRQASREMGVAVGAAELQQEIANIEAFHVDGRFDAQQYRILLATQGMSPLSFEARVRQDLEVRALPRALGSSAMATTADIDAYFRMRDQKRDFRYFEVPAVDDGGIADPEEQVLADYHASNASRYQTEERVSIEYLEVDASTIPVPSVPDEESLRQRYEEQKARFTEIEQRRASHILVKVAVDAAADAQLDAQAKARSLVEQARAEGADFAQLARDNSDDIGSRAGGGELGWIEAGLTDPAFESALFAMEAGAVSEPVKSSEGWHVILLHEVRPGDVKSFESVRESLQGEYMETERERAFSELAGRLVDITYRDPTTLGGAANELGLEIKQAGPFGRFGGMDPISANPAVLRAAFNATAISERTSSDPIDLGNSRTIVLRVTEHEPSMPMALDEVREQVLADWRRDERARIGEQQVAALLARLQGGESIEALALETGAELVQFTEAERNRPDLDRAVAAEVFALPRPSGDAPATAALRLGGERRAILSLDKVTDGDPAQVPAFERTAMREQLSQVIAAAEVRELLDLLKQRFRVVVAEQRI